MQELRFAVFGEGTESSRLRCYGADGQLQAERDLPANKIDELVDEVEKAYGTTSPDLQKLGRRLYAWLDGPTERWLAKALTDANNLAIHIDVSEQLRHLPWELLCDAAFLCANPLRPVTPMRRVRSTHSQADRENRPLRVLLMACSAEGVEPVLDFEHEERLILQATEDQPIELVVEESGSLGGLTQRIASQEAGYYDIMHLTGHASIRDGRPCFIMEDDIGQPVFATAANIAGAFQGRWPRLVFLSGCRTGEAIDRGVLPSLCEQIVEVGAPAVLGWALPVGDQSASVVAAHLYGSLAIGQRIDEAVARARARLVEEESPDWHLLRLYTDATPLTPPVTALEEPGRLTVRVRHADVEFIDAGSKSEVCPRELFVGRRRAIQRCLRILRARQGQPDYHDGVVLTGMGGLGKSSLAARLCERMTRHRRTVCVGLVDETGFLNVLQRHLDDSQAVAVLNEPDVPLDLRLRRLLSLQDLQTSPVLFVFDDFEHNLDDSADGSKVLKPAALDVLTVLLDAVRRSGSACRVLITCRHNFPVPDSAKLHVEPLESMRGADLQKELALLPALDPKADTDEALRDRAIKLADGNPRLLKRLDKVLQDKATDHDAIFAAMDAVAEEFREEVFLRVLLDQQTEECRRLLALLSLVGLPIDRSAVEAIADDTPVDPHLARAGDLGLVESAVGGQAGERHYFVSGLLDPLLEPELTADQRTKACQRAARHLHRVWCQDSEEVQLDQALEVHRLAILAGEKDIAVEIGAAVSSSWINRNRYREAQLLCQVTLALGEDCRILHNLARAEQVLGNAGARQHFERALAQCPRAEPDTAPQILGERAAIIHNLAGLSAYQGDLLKAMELWQQSIEIKEQIGDVSGRAATLQNMGHFIAHRGDVEKAMELWQQSMELMEQIGEDRGKAATLQTMGYFIAQQGDIEKAMELWQQSMELTEQIGDVRGKAATLANMAWTAGKQGDSTKQRQLNLDAARALTAIGAWIDVTTVLGNLGMREDQDATGFLAQAFCLALRVAVPADDAVGLAAALLTRIGAESDAGPLVAAAGNFVAHNRGSEHPKQEEMQRLGGGMIEACAEAHGVAEDEDSILAWFKSQGLDDPDQFIPKLDEALEAIVGDENWLFDRSAVRGD